MADNHKAQTTKQPSGPRMGPGRGGLVEKPKNFWGTTARLFGYMRNRLIGIIAVLVLAIASTVFQIRTPKILGEATTEIFKGVMKGQAEQKAGIAVGNYPIDFDKIKQIILIVLVLYLGSALFSFLQQFIMTRISQNTVYQLRKDLKHKMKTVPIKYYDTHSNGDIMSRAINDMDNIASTLQQSLTQMVTSAVMFVGTIWMMLTISWKLTLIALVTIPLGLIVVGIVAPKSQRFFAAQQKALGLLNNQVEETYGGQVIIKSFNREDDEVEAYGVIDPEKEVSNGTITLGNVQAFLQYMQQFSQPISQLANLANTIQSTIASAERIFAVLDEEDMQDEPSGVPAVANDPNKLVMDHVQFGYTPDALLLKDYNLQVKPGEMVAIVGPTGAGKTTIINLLERFYDISGGSIRLNGTDTRDMKREDVRAHFAMVLQDTWLFTGTIWDNLKYGREDATDDEVLAAAKAAHVDNFVRQLPDGYNTILNEEASNISQGQRQLLTIARAFVADPEILILDEATSSVDTRTEIHIQHAMNRLLTDRTSFVVAHRLSTIRDADKIIVMNHGSIVETGNHDELMAKNGFYADLYNSQFSGNVAI